MDVGIHLRNDSQDLDLSTAMTIKIGTIFSSYCNLSMMCSLLLLGMNLLCT